MTEQYRVIMANHLSDKTYSEEHAIELAFRLEKMFNIETNIKKVVEK